MNARKFAFSTLLVLVFLLSACGAAAPKNEAPAESTRDEYVAPTAAVAQEAFAPEQEAMGQPSVGAAPSSVGSTQPERKGDDEPADMFFEDYGTNPIIDTEDDHLSTFALDVDTGSYTVMRNYLNDGHLPPPNSVRVEEYVNYFEQGYEQPSERQTFSINLDGAPSPFTQTERYEMLRVGIQGYEVSAHERKEVSLTFVIDVSGSMDMENRLEMVKDSLEMLVDELGRGDRISIVVYGSEARVVLDPTPATDVDTILRAISSLRTEGSTNAEAGLKLGYKMAMRAFNADGINRVILCSDGVANVGQTQAEAILDEVRGYTEEGISLATFGFGMGNYNDTFMEQLADNGDGFYAYIDDLDEAERVFVDDLTGTLQTIALDAKVQVDFNPDVVSRYRLVGYENRDVADEDFRDNSVDAGEIGAGHSVTALYEVKLYRGERGRVATVHLRWEDPDTHEVIEMEEDIYASDFVSEFEEANPYFQRAVVVAEYAEILGESYWAQESDMDDIYDEARRLEEYFGHEDAMEEFVDLVKKARRELR